MNKRMMLMFFASVCAAALLFAVRGTNAADAAGAVTVVIDAAHGGSDEGVVVSRGVTEKEVTLEIARMIRDDLQKAGKFKVLLTRDGDRDLSIQERRRAALQKSPALFVSIHVNAGFGKDAAGYEIYVAEQAAPQKDSGTAEPGGTVRTEAVNESMRFARIIQRNLNAVFPREGRGIRNAPAAILDGLTFPGVVLELGFATNTANRKKVEGDEAAGAIARQLSRSIREYAAGEGE